MPTTISIVVARAANGVIGNDGNLPWHLPADLKRFRNITMGKPLIMGRLTHLSIGRALPGRRNIVLTRNQDAELAHGCERASSLEHALQLTTEVAEAMVIGGAEVYRQCLAMAQRIYLTEVMAECPGELLFPEPIPGQWRECERCEQHADEHNQYGMQFVTLERLA
ncbi:MAG: dihydrofolate reductase [Candidatus Porifericomitaceae bacterium WSBS_2022_MAG_OTU9]